MLSTRKIIIVWLALSLALFATGCKKKPPVPPPPPPPAVEPPPPPPPAKPAAPTVSQFSAEPSSIQRGQSSTLRWQVAGNVTTVSINEGIGTVQSTGSRSVSPSSSTTYTLTATGAGGNTTSSATVSVSAPPPPPTPPVVTAKPTLQTRMTDVQDVYYDYDKSDIRSDARDVLTRNASAIKSILADFPGASLVVEGHCDERGSAEYNLGLGDSRASAAKDFLVQLGVPADRLRSISYGKERPQCTTSDEACWQRNRRAHFSTGQ